MKVAIIGAGLIGKKRAASLDANSSVAFVADTKPELAKELADKYGAAVAGTWQEAVNHASVDTVVVATTNNVLSEISIAALKAGKHVLVEKPAGRFPAEVQDVVRAARESKAIIRVGFNHRFHPGLQKAKQHLSGGSVGPLMYIRARYGHGGRLGYDKEWRSDAAIAGGGELLDQGVHLIDLCRWMGGEFDLGFGSAMTFFWDMKVEDNGFMFLKSPDSKRRAFLHASCTEWKNLFDFEIFGRDGKLEVAGLGRSYGEEEFRFYKMKPEMGPPIIEIEKFPGEDGSWNLEWQAFQKEVKGEKTDLATIEDALRAVTIVHDVYKQS